METKLFNVVFSYNEPKEAIVTVRGTSPEDAMNKIVAQFGDTIEGFKLEGVAEIGVVSNPLINTEEEPEVKILPATSPSNVVNLSTKEIDESIKPDDRTKGNFPREPKPVIERDVEQVNVIVGQPKDSK